MEYGSTAIGHGMTRGYQGSTCTIENVFGGGGGVCVAVTVNVPDNANIIIQRRRCA